MVTFIVLGLVNVTHLFGGIVWDMDAKEIQIAWDSLMSQIEVGVFVKDTNRRFVYVNETFLEFYGVNKEDVLGHTDEEMGWHLDDTQFVSDELKVLGAGVQIDRAHGECIAKGIVTKITAFKYPLYKNGKIIGLVGYFRKTEDKDVRIDGLEKLAYFDNLTHLYNRNGFDKGAEKYVKAYDRYGKDFYIIFIDLNNFKKVNDLYNHHAGDMCLQKVACSLLMIFGYRAILQRHSGDEFVIVIYKDKVKDINALINRIKTSIANINKQYDKKINLGAAVGYSLYSTTNDLNKAIVLADEMMYEDKKKMKGLVRADKTPVGAQ